MSWYHYINCFECSFQVFLNIGGQVRASKIPLLLSSAKGFIAYGTSNFGIADFDNLKVENPSSLSSMEAGFHQIKVQSNDYQKL